MTIYEWPQGVPKRIYGFKRSLDDNRVTTESESGMILQWAKNTFVPRVYSFSLHLTDGEEVIFMNWVRETLCGGAGYFRFRFLNEDPKVYRFREMPDSEGSPGWKEVACEIEEAGL